ncbi:hypothetical protein LX32DRAFT_336650 [Colletotrichum zoysiae]|uniref:Uncharacterized protein n=1 Tax=Colletotrichum zoysiae TaxID=1216348 RepID=A0AAD9HLF1_9PEZI|nr:hypothetical protein LX32DRAFT_336650 [Colletotrichum zoysiae]
MHSAPRMCTAPSTVLIHCALGTSTTPRLLRVDYGRRRTGNRQRGRPGSASVRRGLRSQHNAERSVAALTLQDRLSFKRVR